jgi:pyrophosphatase PpaX
MDGSVAAYPGAEEALLALRDQGVRLAVVTSKLHATAERHLQTMGLAYLFEAIIGADDCANLKPHPEPFQCGLAALGLEPEGVVGVGDTPHDIASARGAGLITAGAGWGAQDPEALLAAQPDFLLDTPASLADLPRLAAQLRES